MRNISTLLFLAAISLFVSAAASEPLPRRASAHDETYPGVRVMYRSIEDAKGRRLRVIITRPEADGRYPVVFLVAWLSCDSVEAPPASKAPLVSLLRSIAQTRGLSFVRVEKAGQGDSDGDCAANDFASELDGYRRAFQSLPQYEFVDPARIFVLGLSNGGGVAPLVAEGVPVRGYVVEGGWVKTWYEHMMEIERRRQTLSGKSSADVNALMTAEASFYADYLLKGEAPAEIAKRMPVARTFWEDADFDHQYGRPPAFYQQLQRLNLAAAWSKVGAPVLVIHGQFDWIMSREDHELIAAMVNKNAANAARFVEIPNMGHAIGTYASMADAFNDADSANSAQAEQLITHWLTDHF
jgi:pimeloyl-ACP methyl ester carboxylesterase